MAQHDFINKKRPTRAKAQPERKPFPVLLIMLAVLLAGGFAYGLWYIKHNADPKAIKAQQKALEQPAKTVIQKPKTPEFINEMKQQEIKVEVNEPEQQGPYMMQCASFKTYAQAETLKAKIAFAGLLAEIKRSEGKNGVWFKVRLGPYETKRLAESDKNKLKRQKIMGCSILLWS